MANPHRGDTKIEVGKQSYTLCFDLNACAMVMEHMGVTTFKDMADGVSLNMTGIKDLVFILWAGLQRHHPELTEKDVGAMDWDLTEIASIIPVAFQNGIMRTTTKENEGKGGEGESDPLPPGTGNESK